MNVRSHVKRTAGMITVLSATLTATLSAQGAVQLVSGDLFGVTGEFQLRRTAWRIEARESVFCYRSPSPDNTQSTRNDVTMSFGIAYHVR